MRSGDRKLYLNSAAKYDYDDASNRFRVLYKNNLIYISEDTPFWELLADRHPGQNNNQGEPRG